MHLVKSQQIGNCCDPNALMTLKEYLEDYASPETRAKGEAMIAQMLRASPTKRCAASQPNISRRSPPESATSASETREAS